MEHALLTLAYLVASVLFILSLRGLSSQETARQGNRYGIVGMVIAIGAALTHSVVSAYGPLTGAIAVGAFTGAYLAVRVAMTAMPELVALLHSFVGLAAVLVGFASYLSQHHSGGIFKAEIFVDVVIGAITFTGSVIAFLKLRGRLSGKPLLLPGRHALNAVMALGTLGIAVLFVRAAGTTGLAWLLAATAIACVLGVHLVVAIGGADMPVVVSMLNSYSGWTASAAGFMLSNDLLIVTGALVGSSGAILSYIMCRAMNRSLINVIFGGFGATPPPGAGGGVAIEGDITETGVAELVGEIKRSRNIIIVPGYGLAVARAQHAVFDFTTLLRGKGKNVRFAIHPVAGRLPGHMNVLLAEANVPYDIVLEMDEINADFDSTDIVLVIGANDIVNPSALEDPQSPIWGMPVLEAWHAQRVVVLKRSRNPGYAGIDNPLFYKANTRMLFGDARDSMDKLVAALRE